MSCDFKEESNDVEVEEIVDISVKVDVITNMPDTVEVEDGIASTSKWPQRTRSHSAKLQDYEVTADDEVTPNGESVHFSLLVGDEPINYSEALNNKKWKFDILLPNCKAIFISNNSPFSLFCKSFSPKVDSIEVSNNLKKPPEALYISKTMPTCPPCSKVLTAEANEPAKSGTKAATKLPLPIKVDPMAAIPATKQQAQILQGIFQALRLIREVGKLCQVPKLYPYCSRKQKSRR
ncbi:hypothetical protein KIW84_014876 [Lathyrus oleraceus]|uniref:Uncharacterized protein n=1 Tax=Pisum sativum TaxID=3888 RepID=A0A9D5BNS1_PEA|nr:hypothetical protein KIW84_014876 [Pisum sativum]